METRKYVFVTTPNVLDVDTKKSKVETIRGRVGNGKMLPNEIPKFLNKLVNLNYDFVNGSRFLPGGRYKTNPLFRRLAIRLLNFFFNCYLSKKNY